MQTALIALLAGALGGDAELENDRTATKVIDAAVAEVAAQGFRGLAMDAVARRAGVSRATVYRRFRDRDRLLEALVTRECGRAFAAISQAAETVHTLDDQLVELFVASLRFTRTHPITSRAAQIEPESLIAFALKDDGALFRVGTALLADVIRKGQPGQRTAQARPLDPDQAAETLVRVFVSFVLLPIGSVDLNNEQALRDYARHTLVPMVLGASSESRQST